jgi:hypothetical protein
MVAVVGLLLPSARFCAGGPAAGVHWPFPDTCLAEIRADGTEPIIAGKRDQKRARGDILAADLAL